jgi:hypothetical protein
LFPFHGNQSHSYAELAVSWPLEQCCRAVRFSIANTVGAIPTSAFAVVLTLGLAALRSTHDIAPVATRFYDGGIVW